jgi:hypothetical protein
MATRVARAFIVGTTGGLGSSQARIGAEGVAAGELLDILGAEFVRGPERRPMVCRVTEYVFPAREEFRAGGLAIGEMRSQCGFGFLLGERGLGVILAEFGLGDLAAFAEFGEGGVHAEGK